MMTFIWGWQSMAVGLNIRLDKASDVFKEAETRDSFKGSKTHCIRCLDTVICDHRILTVVITV